MPERDSETFRQIPFRVHEELAHLARLMAAGDKQSLAGFANGALVREVNGRLRAGWVEKFEDNVAQKVLKLKANFE